MVKCILCEQDCERFKEHGKGGYGVECKTCGRYFLACPEIFESSYINMPREKRAMISAYTRELYEQGKERPELGDDELLAGIIDEYEARTLEQKIENLIWFLRKRSKEFGTFIDINEKRDYPITFSLSDEGFSSTLTLARERGLLTEGALGMAGRLTEAGWKMGTDLIRIKEQPGLIKFAVMFFDNYCILHMFRSALAKNRSLSFGFQTDQEKVYEYEDFIRAITKRNFQYGSKLGLFIQNNITRRRETFTFEIPVKHPNAGPDIHIDQDCYKLDISEIIKKVSHK